MTLILAAKIDNRITLMADSRVSYTDSDYYIDDYHTKLFTVDGDRGKYYIGLCGSYRLLQVLKYGLVLNKGATKHVGEKHMVCEFVPALVAALRAANVPEVEDMCMGAELMVAYDGDLFTVGTDFSVVEYDHFGGFASVALSALGEARVAALCCYEMLDSHTIRTAVYDKQPLKLIEPVMEACSRFHKGIGGDTQILGTVFD